MSQFCCTSVAFVKGWMRKEVKSNGAIRKINHLWGSSIYGTPFLILGDKQDLALHLRRLKALRSKVLQ